MDTTPENLKLDIPVMETSSHNESLDMIECCENYLASFQISETLTDLFAHLCIEKPNNVDEFLVQLLQMKQKEGPAATIVLEKEIEEIFKLFDLENRGIISKKNCLRGLIYLSSTLFQLKRCDECIIPEEVDVESFKNIVKEALRMK